MPLTLDCPHCSSALRLPDDSAGKRVRCPGCKTPIEIRSDETGSLSLHEAISEAASAHPEPEESEQRSPEPRRTEALESRSASRPSVRRSRLRDRKRERKGSKWLLAVASFHLLGAILVLLLYVGNQGRLTEHGKNVFLLLIGYTFLVTGCMFGLHAWSRKKPVPACLAALGVYLGFSLAETIFNPTSFMSPTGMIAKGLTIMALVLAILSSKKQQAIEEEVDEEAVRTASRGGRVRKPRGQARSRQRVS